MATTDKGLKEADFDSLVEKIGFYSPGITVKLINGETDEGVAVESLYNLFVGGNKLGRGVTIKNLLVSYYGRHPKRPQADTVLQHARMYGYRRKDIGLLRLFLPRELHVVFKAINKMELGLRDLIARQPGEAFRGIYIESGLSATRRNILAPGSIGAYSAGSNYNPAQIIRDKSVKVATDKIDKMLENVPNKGSVEMSIEDMQAIIRLTMPDQSQSEHIWNHVAIAESLAQFAELHGHETGNVWVDRERNIDVVRRETAGILAGGEFAKVPPGKLALYLLRMMAKGQKHAAWWPQVRFPDGPYAFAFAV